MCVYAQILNNDDDMKAMRDNSPCKLKGKVWCGTQNTGMCFEYKVRIQFFAVFIAFYHDS